MDRDAILTKLSPTQAEIERLAALPDAPFTRQRSPLDYRPSGVLLSDQIEFYCQNYKLLHPYAAKNIKAANYELRVGLNYSVGGEIYPLKIGDPLTIPKFEVAVIEILETVNMPRFLIGRWNIRTKWAYRGLIWVGGPQIDAGFKGILPCPIWNLSNRDFTIRSGEEIAIIDFEYTTPPTTKSISYPWRDRTRFVFEDYEKPRSAIVTDLLEQIGDLKKLSEDSRTRIDSSTAVMLTALGILTAAITVFVTKGDHQYWWDPTVFWVCAGSAVLALLAWIKSKSAGKWLRRVHALVVSLVVLLLGVGTWQIVKWSEELKKHDTEYLQLKQRIEKIEKQQSTQKP
jgi:hypothetical protein